MHDSALCINNTQHINGLNVNLKDVGRNINESFDEMAIFGEELLPEVLQFLSSNTGVLISP
jgi:hypothetical protein